MESNTKIFVAGHNGLLGQALLKELGKEGYTNVITVEKSKLDLLNQKAVNDFFDKEKPEVVIDAAGRTGGIIANRNKRAQFLYQNICIQTNLIEASHQSKVDSFVFFSSSCVYPKLSEQPMKEEYFMTGPIEETSEAYGVAKISGVMACKAYNTEYNDTKFIALLPNSMFGPFDNFDPENSHVLSALIKKLHDAAQSNADEITLWGSGSPKREFIFSEDVASATIFALNQKEKLDNHHYNIGVGVDISIKELSEKISDVVGFKGTIKWDTSKPDGAARKLLDSSKFNALGWKPSIKFDDGLKTTYEWFKSQNS